MDVDLGKYSELLGDIKARVQRAQTKAMLSANRQMLELYWDVGRLIRARQKSEGWGARVLHRLATDLKNELPEIKGFSETNLKRMTQYFRAYPELATIGAQAVPQLDVAEIGAQAVPPGDAEGKPQAAVATLSLQLPWGHNVLMLQKVKDLPARLWYMQQAISNGWSRNILHQMILNRAHERQGAATTNFESRLPAPQSDLAQQALKDPYIFEFLTIEEPFRERELETGLVQHLQRFLMELGVGFAFIGRQHKVTVGDDDFYLDLLFYHLKLRCFVVIELKVGAFKPDYVGKMNFYLNLVDDTLRHEDDNPTIGLILCQDKRQVLAEYALRGLDKPIGISQYELTRALPEELESSLPTIEEIEAELGEPQESDETDDPDEER